MPSSLSRMDLRIFLTGEIQNRYNDKDTKEDEGEFIPAIRGLGIKFEV